jgi:uncharacterized membrane protein YedE/YeeE
MTGFIALAVGIVFGSGLMLSGMTNPANVLAFLDVTGDWHPALMFTMAAAIAVALPAYAIARRRGRSLRGDPIGGPEYRIDGPLLVGSAIFGVGWGLSGICPGPGLILLSSGSLNAVIFVGGVVAGIFLLSATRRVRSAPR